MKKLKPIIWVMMILLLASCGGVDGLKKDTTYNNTKGDSNQTEVLESDLNLDEHKDKKFIQTADIKYKVKDVFKTTMTIEDVVAKHQGFIAYTNLQNNIQTTNSHQVSEDSSLMITSYIMENQLSIRVPSKNLQKFLRALNQTVDFPNHRIIEAKDVSLDILGQALTQKRLEDYGDRTKNVNLKDSLKQAQNITLLDNQSNIDENILAQKRIEAQIKFSTIEMYIYQNPKITKEMLAIVPDYPTYEPAFSSQLQKALNVAINICKYTLLVLVAVSPFILFGFLIYLIYKNKKKWKFN